jgi:uncharacterized membrane protein
MRNILDYGNIDTVRAVTSYFIPLLALGLTRLLFGLLALAALILSLVDAFYSDGEGVNWFFYLTRLAYVGLTAYLLAAAYHTLRYNQTVKDGKYPPVKTLATGSLWAQLHFMLYTTVVVYHLFVPIIYWLLVYDSTIQRDTRDWITTIMHHGIDALFLLFEVIFSRNLVKWKHLVLIVILSFFYLFYMWVVYAGEGYFVYAFLAFSKGPTVALWYVVMVVTILVLFVIMWGLHWVREWIARKSGADKKFEQPDMQHVDAQSSAVV